MWQSYKTSMTDFEDDNQERDTKLSLDLLQKIVILCLDLLQILINICLDLLQILTNLSLDLLQKFLILYLDLCKKMYLCGEIKIANHYVSKKCNETAQKLED